MYIWRALSLGRGTARLKFLATPRPPSRAHHSFDYGHVRKQRGGPHEGRAKDLALIFIIGTSDSSIRFNC